VFDTIILLTGMAERDTLAALLRAQNPALTILTPQAKAELLALPQATLARARIIGFLTPIVVPANVLAALGYGAYNFHPGPPSYPGWLPSHFAVYDRAPFFGATAHLMAPEVDSGPIVGVELFGVPPGAGVEDLDKLAFVQCARLIWRLAPALARDPAPLPDLRVQWSGRCSTKAMVRAACDIPADVGKDELERRLAAFGAGHFGNVPTVTLHGHTFRYVPPAADAPPLVPEAQADKQVA
jgi:methionyl-tRNA formyltransferase